MNGGPVLTQDRAGGGDAGPSDPDGLAPGVEGNSRLTGAVGSVLFVLLAGEALTLLWLHQLISWHVFLGLLLVPLVLVKTATHRLPVRALLRRRPDLPSQRAADHDPPRHRPAARRCRP